MIKLAAGVPVPLGPIEGLGTVLGKPSNPALILSNLISTLIGLLTVVAAIYFTVQLVTGSIAIISSGGEKGAYEDARRKITTGIIGLIVTISAVFIMDVIATLLGVPTLLDLVTTIGQIQVK